MAKKDGIAAVLKEKKDPVPLDQMTLRDLLAAFACVNAGAPPDLMAKYAYEVADAMLEERVK